MLATGAARIEQVLWTPMQEPRNEQQPERCARHSELVAARLARRDRLAALDEVAARYAVAITPAMADLIDPADPHDPIARQFVPDARELELQPEERGDPIGDACA